MQKRLDVFLSSFLCNYPELFAFCQKLLILSHGQATVERGFSVNKHARGHFSSTEAGMSLDTGVLPKFP